MAGSVIYCANIAELTNTMVRHEEGGLRPAAVCAVVAGYNNPGDGGGGEFYWASSAPLQGADGGTVFKNHGGGFWVRIFSGPISVRWFGAWGDGFSGSNGAVRPNAHDDTAAIMNAFAAAGATGSAVYFPPGAYQVSPQTTTLRLGGLSSPGVVCAGGNGDLYVADSASKTVFHIARNYGVYSVVGTVSNPGAVTSLAGIAADASGSVYMGDNSSKAVYKFSFANNAYTKTQVAGSFSAIAGVGVDNAGNIYVADSGVNTVYQVPWGGTTYEAPIPIGTFTSLTAIAVNGSGLIYVLDSGGNAYWMPPPFKGLPQPSKAISLPSGLSPTGIAVDDSSNLYVLDPGSHAIYRLPLAIGVAQTSEKISLPAQLLSPVGIAVDDGGSIYVSDAGTQLVYHIDRGALLVDYKATGSRISAIAGAGIATTIIGHNVAAGHAVLELLGFDNVRAVNCELKNFQIAQDITCDPQSYAMRMGDANSGFSAERMTFRGANGVLLRISSSASYAQICTVFRNCILQSNDGDLWEGTSQNPAFYSLGSESHGAQWDNVLFESCSFEGLVSCVANMIEFDNCNFSTSALRGVQYGCCAEVLVDNATFHDCYFEDHYAAIRIQPATAEIRRISIYDCYFSGNANLKDEKPMYGVWLQLEDLSSTEHRTIWEVNIARCVFTDDLYKASVAIDTPDMVGPYVNALKIDGAINLSSSGSNQVVTAAPITVIGAQMVITLTVT